MKKNKRINDFKIKIIISGILIALLLITFPFSSQFELLLNLKSETSEHLTTSEKIEASAYYVSYINVGQGNSSFIKLPDGKTVLIDGGDSEYGETVSEFLKKHNVSAIDYMIATHADADHIGGLNCILENFEVKNVFRPFQIAGSGTSSDTFETYEYEQLDAVYRVLENKTDKKMSRVTTAVYKNFIKNIYTEKYTSGGNVYDCKVTVFYDGLKVSGENYEIEFFAPLKRADNLSLIDYPGSTTYGYATVGYGTSGGSSNDNSAIFTLKCFNDKYLFMGDARYTESDSETLNFSEGDFIESLTDIEKEKFAEINVLLVAHHGSKYSTSAQLLEIVKPNFVVISSGNEYGHPADETLVRISNVSSLASDYLVRTDKNGNIEFSNVDGQIKYSLQAVELKQELKISYKLLASSAVAFLIVVIFSIKPRKAHR